MFVSLVLTTMKMFWTTTRTILTIVSVSVPLPLRFLADDEGMGELGQGAVETESEGLTQTSPQFGEAFPPRGWSHTPSVISSLGTHPEI